MIKNLFKLYKKAFEGDDKYPGQNAATSTGYQPENGLAYEPTKRADGDRDIRMKMYWDFVKDSIFDKGNRWSGTVKQLKKLYSEITSDEIEELADKLEYEINQLKMQRESFKKSDIVDDVKQMAEKLLPVSPTRISLYKVLKQSFPTVDEQIIHQVMREMIKTKEANFGFFDGPVDLGKHHDGDFPSVTWLPRGREDSSVNEDTVTSSKKEAFRHPLTLDEQSQVAAKYGPEYNTALMHFFIAKKNQHADDRAFLYAINEMQKVNIEISEEKLLDAIKTYLVGR